MVKLTASQKKKLKLHAVNQTASHMKKMVKLMRDGDTFNEAHKEASKSKSKSNQKQKQSQSQKVIINLATPKKRRTKPRANAQGGSARVLSQFIQPQQALPDYRTLINPTSMPMPFMTPTQSPQLNNEIAPRPDAPTEGRILGRGDPLETPLEVSNVLKSVNAVDRLLSGKKQPDDTATEGRTLLPTAVRQYQTSMLPQGMWRGGARGDAGISSLSDTESDASFRPSMMARGSSTEATRGLGRVNEASEDEGFGGGGGMPSPSLMRRY
tara:strand:+ start:38 stop:841 length:804 start_codon:yes stop_codon:yes gene_type:complete